jgi:hypothetical protein
VLAVISGLFLLLCVLGAVSALTGVVLGSGVRESKGRALLNSKG